MVRPTWSAPGWLAVSSGRQVQVQVRAAALRRAVRRQLTVLVLVAVGLVWTFAVRHVPDEAHASGVAVVAAIDARFAEVRDGSLRLPTEPSDLGDGIEGAVLSMREGVSISVLVRPDGDRCYALWWNADLVRNGRLVASNRLCSAATYVASNRPVDFDLAGPIQQDPAAPYDWDDVVPDPVRLRFWFLPAVGVLGGVGLAVLVRLSLLAITREPLAGRR